MLKPLNHPNVVKVTSLIHDEFKGQLIMIMEYVQGLTLEDYVLKIQNDKQRMPDQEVAFILRQLVQAIQYIHQQGICHRDLKPDNVLINPKTKEIKLTDFNISKRFIDEDQTRLTMRTRTGLDSWSAPETRQGGSYEESVDYWGIGVIGYFMVMQHPPFYDSDEVKLLEKVQNCRYQKLTREIRDIYQSGLCDLITKLIVANPHHRPTPIQMLKYLSHSSEGIQLVNN